MTMRSGLYFRLGTTTLALGLSMPLAAQVQQRSAVMDIPAQDLGSALKAIATATGEQVIFRGNAVRGKLSNTVQGTYSAERAVALAIEGKGLTISRSPRGVIMVIVATTKARPASVAAVFALPEPEIVVTGSRLKQSEDSGTGAVTLIRREQIDALGVTNVGDALKYLPQQASWSGDVSKPGGGREIRLRGLGAGTTLVLVNGRRAPVSGLGATQNFFDLNSIPLAAVDRIEILSDSASAVYGADAVGGVVNIVLKSDIRQPTVDVYHGFADGGARETRASLALGHSWSHAKVGAVFDYYDRSSLLGAEREIYGNADYSRFGGIDRRVTTTNPGNVCSTNGQNLPGLSAPCAAVPVGSSGIALTPADFSATAGQVRRDSLTRYRALVGASERFSGLVFANIDLADSVSAFAEFGYNRLDGRIAFGAEPRTNLRVPASNAFNPFGADVFLNYAFDNELGRAQYTRSESWRAVAGLKGRLKFWDWEVSGTHFSDDAWQDNTRNSIDTVKLNAALASSNPATAFNPFQDGSGASDSLLHSLIADPLLSRFYSKSESSQFSAFVRGSLFTLPAGEVQVVIGSEYRSEDLRIRIPGTGYAVDGDRSTWAVYSELRAPILRDDLLTATLAGRYDRYSDFGGTFNPKYGLELRPANSLLLRASYGSSFRAPSLWDLYSPRFTVPSSIIQDPARGNETATYTRDFGGNPNLNPEEAKSFSTGFVFTPRLSGGDLRISVNYWSIEQKSRINTLDILLLLQNEALFPNRIIRAAPNALDVAAGRPGSLVSVDTSSINFGKLSTDGIDFEASASAETSSGRISGKLAATWISSYKVQNFPGQASVDVVGVAGDFSTATIPRWRAVTGLGWSKGGAELTTTMRFVSGYDDRTLGVLNGNRVDAEALIDLQLNLDVGRLIKASPLKDLTLRLGVTNLFDRTPQYSDALQQGYDPATSDIRGRFAYVSASKKF